MSAIENRLRKTVKELLEEGKIKYFIGYEKGSDAFRTRPVMIHDPKDVDKLIWSPTCVNNLAVFLVDEMKKQPKKGEEPDLRHVGILVKPCDARAITVLVQENILPRDRVYVISIPCTGKIDSEKLEHLAWKKGMAHSAMYDMDIEEQKMMFTCETEGVKEAFPREEVLLGKCKECTHHNPREYDLVIGDRVNNPPVDKYAGIRELEGMSVKEREKYWEALFERCIRCSACKEVCPMCYCEECVAEKAKPMRWASKSVDRSNNAFFHLIRAMHMVGRCIDCGECERACPMDIPLRKLYRKLEKEVKKLYGYEAGLNSEDVPLFATFSVDDPDEFDK